MARKQFSISSILVLTAATAIAIVLLSPVIFAAQRVGLYFSLTHALGFLSPILALGSLLAIPAITFVQLGSLVHEEKSIDRWLQLCLVPIYGMIFFLCLYFDLKCGYLLGMGGSLVTVLTSLVCLLVAIIRNDGDRIIFASVSLFGASLAWHFSSTIIYAIVASG